jgi:catechol 2,3-dioxygenase-like lactoylglutathione lyase family enzyme
MRPNLEGLVPLLQVFDMPTSVRFYRDILGFEIVQKSSERSQDDSDWVWLRRDGMELMLNTAFEFEERPSALDPSRAQAHRDTALYFACRDLDGAYSYLQSKGVKAKEPKVAPHGMRQLHLSDPDGYVLCLQWPAA